MSPRINDLILRADATVHTGTGHVMRCLALAQAWRRLGGRATFVCCELPEALRDRLGNEGFSVQSISGPPGSARDVIQTQALAERQCAEWVVLDGYDFNTNYQRAWQSSGRRILLIDDLGQAEHYAADAVLNQNLYADAALYGPRDSKTRLLLGASYALLRDEFSGWKDWRRESTAEANKKNLLVMFGGADEQNITGSVLQGLAAVHGRIPGLQVTAILGGNNPHAAQLQSLAGEMPYPVQLAHNVADVPCWLAWADLAIGAAGSTCWEMAFMGLPVLTVVVAENQVRVGQAIQSYGLGRNLGWNDELTPAEIAGSICDLAADRNALAAMSSRGRGVIDGDGALRVAQFLSQPRLRLRPATEADARQIWLWRNEPQTRRMSFSDQEIPYESHVQWLGKKLQSEDCQILIAENMDGAPVGQIRFDFHGQRAEISIVLDRHRRGSGIGTALIAMASEQLLQSERVSAIDAYIKPGNEGSCRAFEKAGYRLAGRELVHGTEAHRYVAEGVGSLFRGDGTSSQGNSISFAAKKTPDPLVLRFDADNQTAIKTPKVNSLTPR